MKDHSRRSFVKTSAATGLTFTFAGLIRAHGQSGGGTTWNPEVTFGSTFGSDISTTWNQEATYVATTWPGNGYSTTYDPLATNTTAPEYTTCDPNAFETTQAETEAQTTEATTPTKYTLKSNVTGSPEPGSIPGVVSVPKDQYNERWMRLNVKTTTGALYSGKLKFWVDPPIGRGNKITIDYKGELFPNGIPSSIPQLGIQTTPKVTFMGELPDVYFPIMYADINPPDPSPAVGTGLEFSQSYIVPTTIMGSLSTKPPDLDTIVWTAIQAGKPSTATQYVLIEALQLALFADSDFSTLPSSARAFAKVTLSSTYTVEYYDNADVSLGILGLKLYDSQSIDQMFIIEVIVD